MDRTRPGSNPVAILRARRAGALAAIGEAVLAESSERVPVDTGELRDSGGTSVVGDRVYIGYKDGKATAVHEDMTSQFEGGRRSKFLESAVLDVRADLLRLAAERLR